MARSLLVVVSLPVLLILGRKGAIGVSAPDVLKSTASTLSSSVLQVGMLSHFLSMEKHYFQQVCANYGNGSPSSA